MPAPLIIIGATGAIGSAIARRAAARGQALHLIARDEARLAALSGELGGTHAVADVMDPAALAAAVQAAGAEVAGLAYAVGSIRIVHLDRATPEQFMDAFRLNALGAALAIQAAAPALRANPGSAVVLFSTIAVRTGFPGHAVIAAAKGAVEGLVTALAAEFAPEKALGAAHPIPRLGEGDDAGALADFLLSPAAAWITGQIIGVDGGRSTLRPKG